MGWRALSRIPIAVALCAACGDEALAPAAVPVVVAEVAQKDVPITMEWIGTTQGAVDAVIRAQVSGYLISREYSEGTQVKKDALLFRIDPRSYQAALEQARGDLGRRAGWPRRRRARTWRATRRSPSRVRSASRSSTTPCRRRAPARPPCRPRAPRWTRRSSISRSPRSARRSTGSRAWRARRSETWSARATPIR